MKDKLFKQLTLKTRKFYDFVIENKTPQPEPDYYSIVLFTDQLNQYYKNVTFEGGCAIKGPGFIKIGANSRMGYNSSITAIMEHFGEKYSPSMTIGEGTNIGSYNAIAVCNKIVIGNNVLFGPHIHINDHSHRYQDISKPIMYQPVFSKGPIIIEDESWIGFGSHILSGVTIGKHSVIGANSVVTKSIPPYSVAVGMPAKVIKQYNFETGKWEVAIR